MNLEEVEWGEEEEEVEDAISEAGEAEVSLKKEGRTICLSVSNTISQPMERETLEHLFDRFYRADQSRSSRTGGYGLGLSIAKSVVAAHRGKIRAECPGGGRLSIVVDLPG